VVAFTTVTLVADIPPIVTVAGLTKPVPVIVTRVPPERGPELGETLVNVGIAAYINPPVSVAEPPEIATTTFLAPAVPAGVTAVMEVALTTVTLVAATPPIVTVAPLIKPVPVIVTGVPPTSGPAFGEILVIVTTK
jgi:hypothetical protein